MFSSKCVAYSLNISRQRSAYSTLFLLFSLLGNLRIFQQKQLINHENLICKVFQRRIYEAGGMGYGPDAYEPFLNPLRDSSSKNRFCWRAIIIYQNFDE